MEENKIPAIKFLLFLERNNALFVGGEKKISDTLLFALILFLYFYTYSFYI